LIQRDLEERDLLRKARRGDEAATRLLYARIAPSLLVYARSILRDADLAEDAVQGAFLRMFRMSVRKIHGVQCPRAMLAAWTRSESLTMLRTQRRRETREGAWRIRDEQRRMSMQGWEVDLVGEVRQAVDALPRQLREVVVLKHVAQMTFDQMSLAIGVSRNTLAARHRRAMDQLRQSISHDAKVRGRTDVV